MSNETKFTDRGAYIGKLTVAAICGLVLLVGTVCLFDGNGLEQTLPASIVMSAALISLGLLSRS